MRTIPSFMGKWIPVARDEVRRGSGRCGPQALLREEELQLDPQLPVRTVLGRPDVIVGLDLSVERELSEMEDLANAAADRDDPGVLR